MKFESLLIMMVMRWDGEAWPASNYLTSYSFSFMIGQSQNETIDS